MSATTIEQIDIYDPDRYVAAAPHDVFERLRREQPVYRQKMPDGTWYWAVMKHADLVYVARNPLLFSAEIGGVVLEDQSPERLAQSRNMLLAMDPPRHTTYRRPLSPQFKSRVIAGLEGRVREICRSIMVEARERRTVEFVHEVTAGLPSQVVAGLMGLPQPDLELIQRWAEMNTSSQDPEIDTEDSAYRQAGNGMTEMGLYAIEFAKSRRIEAPREDLTTLILETEFAGSYMTDLEFAQFFVQMVTAGNDTTKTMLASGLLALLQHPEQLASVQNDRSRIPGAVEEILRWANPLHYFRRTLSADAELHGVQLHEGDKVAMMYTSANRDEDVFADPHAFDITRDPNPHLSFGIAEHFCLGVHLARLEGRVFFDELFNTFRDFRVLAEPRRVRSNLNNALKELQVELIAR